MSSTAIRQVRLVGILEGISFVVLLGIAMPLKYMAGMPRAVSWVGMAHGVLFVIWSLSGAHGWPLPVVTLAVPVIAFAGMRIMFFRLEGEAAADTRGDFYDLAWEEVLAIAPLALILLVLGIIPSLILGPIGVSIATLLKGLNGN